MRNLRKAILTFVLFYNVQVALAQTAEFGKSYINVSKGTNGGTLEPGDILEIRASFVVTGGDFDSCSFSDVIPTGTTYIPGTIRVLTNEGKIYKQFTDAATDDEGWITGTNVRINMGYNQTVTTTSVPARWNRRGTIASTHVPRFGGSCIMLASYRVQINYDYNSFINTGGGTFTYKPPTTSVRSYTLPSNRVAVYKNYGICPNSIGANTLGTEFNGTFGSGKPRNRGTSANVPTGYGFKTFTTGSPNDYFYGIANNTSTENYTTSNAWPKPDNATPTHRVFRLWDIIGDHSGAADPFEGNPAADTVANPNAGYMLVINAAYKIDSAFQHTISGLCPNTYYEISCWMRNICSKCGSDSLARGASTAGYIPTGVGDSSGVAPNLTFDIDGVDYYSTGNLVYSGKWVKKGFTFLTGPNQTSFTLKFFNNAPGGGGNDWALDDISVAVCNPNMVLTPSANPIICNGNVVDMSATIQSYFGNHNSYKWQKSTNNGVSWTETGLSGNGTPVMNNNSWEYKVQFPQFVASKSDSGAKYKIVVATTDANLANSCAFNSNLSDITVHVIDCGPVLHTDILSFSGQRTDGKNHMKWTSSKEEEKLRYVVERSTDGQYFNEIASVSSHMVSDPVNSYEYTDLTDKNVFYRIKVVNESNTVKFSRIIRLGSDEPVMELYITNPFNEQLLIRMLGKEGLTQFALLDMNGRMVMKHQVVTLSGINQLQFHQTGKLPDGVYILQVQSGNQVISKRVLKQSNR